MKINLALVAFLLLLSIAAQANDNFADATVINDNAYCSGLAEFTNLHGTADGAKPIHWSNDPTYNVWFKFQATTTEVAIDLKTGGSEGTLEFPMLALHDAAGAELRSTTHDGRFVDIGVSYNNLTAGNWYYINVDIAGAIAARRGTFTLCVDDAVSNDYPEGAIEITSLSDWCSGLQEFTNFHGTADGSKPTNWSADPSYNVWFKFQATTNEIAIDLKTGDDEGDLEYPSLALHDALGVELRSTTHDGKYVDIGVSYNALTIGEWYYINVDVSGSVYYRRGSFTLCVDDAVSNDYPEGAIEIATPAS